MSQSIKSLFKPPYYVLEDDKQLKLSVQKISDHKQKGGLNGHALAVAQAVHSISLSFFMNIPCCLVLGSKNLFLNCIHLRLEHMVLEHYTSAMYNLIYSVIATVYVAMGIFIPPVLDGFKMGESQSDDLNTPLDSDLSTIIENQRDSERSETRSLTPSSSRKVSLSSISSTRSETSATSNGHGSIHSPDCSSSGMPSIKSQIEVRSLMPSHGEISLPNSTTELSYSFNSRDDIRTPPDDPNNISPDSSLSAITEDQRGSDFSTHSRQDPLLETNGRSNELSGSFIPFSDQGFIAQDYMKEGSLSSRDQNGVDSERENGESISSQPSQANSIPASSIKIDLNSLSVESGDWSMISNVKSFAIKSTNIRARDMIGTYGINLERHAYRTALNEYIRILKDDFDINAEEKLTLIESWLSSSIDKGNPIVNALYRTLFYLIKPVAYDDKSPIYTHAKEQYERYVTSLREVLAMIKCQEKLEGPNLKECLTLIRALCEARFLSKNHGLLRSLLQLCENEYDRLNPEREEIPAVTRENFAQVVMAKNKKVKEAPASMKVSSTQRSYRMACGAVGYEDFLMTDIPFLRGKQVFKNDQGEERSFYYMRHPTPHIAGSPAWITLGAVTRAVGLGHVESGETIAPEFQEMLEAIAARGESYLIQSHQRLNDTGTVENEDSRSQTLYHLQTSHKNFHVVFQAVEGDLFDHKGSYEKIMTFADLKEAIQASFDYEKRDTSPNRLPACLEQDKEYRDVIGQLLDQVHQTLFGNRVHISFDGQDPTQSGTNYPNYEWQAFILAFYILQGDDLKFRLPNVKYFCTNCKNFFDRGGNRAMAEDRLHQEMSKKEITSEDLEATIVNLVPVPLQSKGKAVIEKRLKPGLALAEILATLSLEDRQRLQRINFEGYKPDRFEVSKKEQRAVPLIEDICTLQEMQEIFKSLQGKSYSIIDSDIVQKNWATYQEKDQINLFGQINSDLKRLKVHVDGTLYDAQGSNKAQINDAKEIFEYLKKSKINEDLALQAMAQMQQSIFFEPLSGLMKAFQHHKLGLSVTNSSEERTIDVVITEDDIEIEAKNSLFYKTTSPDSPYFRKSPIAVFNTTVLVTIPKDGSGSHAHWTWEVTEVS